jgi:STE24 endopeptidase
VLAFWFTGGFNFFDGLVRSWGLPSVLTGIIYIGLLLLFNEILNLPFGIYGTFIIEERFGFNRTTKRTFISDLIKGLGLAIVIGGPLLAAVLALFQYAGIYAWIYCWAAVTIFSLIMQFVFPTWIMPLFNKFKPMPDGDLKSSIFKYAESVKFPIKNVFVMDGSKRSSKSNAFFTGFGRNKRIALFDTLIEQHTVPELVAVLAHEVGHYKKKHIIQGMVISILHMGVILFLLSLFIHSAGLYQAFFVQKASIYTGLLFFGLLYTPIEMVFSILMQMVSRQNEYAADRFAAETVNDPSSMIDALKKLSAKNLSNLTPHPFYVFMNYSHPALLQRLQAIKNVKRKGKPVSN